MLIRKRTHEVFGISTDYRPISYVDRGQLDAVIQRYLDRDVHIALRGESKSGKSWLRQKLIPDAIVVQCRLGKGVNELYIDALSQLDIKLEIESRTSSSLTGRVTAQGDFGVKLLAKLGVGAAAEARHDRAKSKEPVGHDVHDLRFIADIAKASGRILVIEDFHYMSTSERTRFAFELKTLWDYGLYSVIIGVWSQSNMLLSLNPDLSGRVHEVPISWSPPDLEAVLDKGAEALDLSFPSEFKSAVIELSYGNVGILQKLILETLDHAGIHGGGFMTGKVEVFADSESLQTAALFYAEQLNPLYQQFAERVSRGIRSRKDSTGIYAHAMAVIMDASDEQLVTGLHVDQIHERAHARQSRIQKGNLKTILEKVEGLQVDAEGRGLVVSYNESTEETTVVDRQLLLYRRYCTVKWPWEGLIAEAEAEGAVS